MKESAISFLQLAAAGHAEQAFNQYCAPGFCHHNPFFRSDGKSLMTAMQQNAIAHPDKIFEVQRALQDGELVAVHSRIRFQDAAHMMAVVHLFRFHEGKIIELWDVGQAVPDQSPNELGMF